ncbi:hypothetical protein A9R04_22915 [Nocardiopsis dassonvillei]|uniref:hypothetical protein n=1 Tax=Nocardiopsis dassonvillei TaxID=2014 RepID=UPI0008FC2D31|nr:hypothetical protein [Nocardiopsis dassonvillei]APC37347.1 hypothetical protein A9R04_22915 [Nocardiopsis dassonvillei]
MRQFSAALLSRAFGPLIAFFSSPCGRHSTVVGRRRRSSRVRRYAPSPPAAPVQTGRDRAPSRRAAPEPPASPGPRQTPARTRVPAPRLAPPRERIDAEEVALVRPYFTAHESLRAAETRVPAPRQPEHRNPAPSSPGPQETETEEVRRAFEQARIRAAAIVRQWREDPGGDLLGGPVPRFGVVGPPRPTPVPAQPGEWDELTSRIRLLLRQRQGATV